MLHHGAAEAITTKLSPAGIRSTHVTGVVTDIGIELGRLLYWNLNTAANSVHVVRVNRDKLSTNLTVLSLFAAGGVAGAYAFGAVGFKATLPIALGLALLALPPILADLHAHRFRKGARVSRLASRRLRGANSKKAT